MKGVHEAKTVIEEFKALQELKSINIVQAKDIFINENTGKIQIVTELVEGDELSTVIENSGAFSERAAAELFKQII